MDPVKVWQEGSKDALDTAQKLYASKKYNHALFFLHLAIEKILKAIYTHKNNVATPYVHNLVLLAEKAEIKTTTDEKKQLAEITEFNVSTRYEDYKYRMYKKATPKYAQKWLEIGKGFLKKFTKEL